MIKIKKVGALAFLLCCSLSTQAFAQDSPTNLSMTLEECLEYAKLNSITIQQARLDIEDSEFDQLSAKGAFLPTVSGSVSQSFNSNPANTDPDANKSTYTGTYGVDLSMTLYNGGENRASLKQSLLGTQIASLDLDTYANSLEVSVTEVFVEILYAMEQIGVAELSLERAQKSEQRGESFYELGSINAVDLAQLQSATASYQYDLIVSQTQLSNLYVTLKHLLEISYDVEFAVKVPNLSSELLMEYIPSLADVYAAALDSRPEIEVSKLNIESAELSARIAKSGYLPTLKLTAGTGLNHNSVNDFTLSNQLRNNFNTSAGLSLSVPIFNNFATKTSVAKSQNAVKSAALSLTQVEKDLYKTIETLHTTAATSQAKYAVSELQLKASTKSVELTTQQYELGMKNTIELLTEQDNYSQAQQEFLMNKYQLILNKALLNYYRTNIIKL